MEAGYVKGQSDNLPKIDGFMIAEFFANSSFVGAEIRGAKLAKSSRESYGDDAIGYVQVKRQGNICTVKARVTPEHRVRIKPYHCTLVCDEASERIEKVECDDCAASLGGCKHAVALITWLHRRSEEPATTSTKCYWLKPKLSQVGTTLKYITAQDIEFKGTLPELNNHNGLFMAELKNHFETSNTYPQFMNYFRPKKCTEKVSMHYLICAFKQQTLNADVDVFIEYCKNEITPEICCEIENITSAQVNSKLWYELRYGRITASVCYQVAHCATDDGTLVEQIFGAKLAETFPMRRGKVVEADVRSEVARKKNIAIRQAGLFLKAYEPLLGASPDGVTDDYVVEIKCPISKKTMANYVTAGVLKNRYRAQIQLQMYFADKRKGLFCIAHPDFETSKCVDIFEIEYDVEFCREIRDRCVRFWKKSIFQKLM